MSMDLSAELQVEGTRAWMIADTFAIGAFRMPAERAGDAWHDVVEDRYCFGLGDIPCEVTVEGEGSALAGLDVVRFHEPGDCLVQRKAPEDGWAQNWVVLSEDLLHAMRLEVVRERLFPASFVRAPLPQLAAVRSFFRRVERGECPVWAEETLTSLVGCLLQRPERAAPRRAPTRRQRDLALQADELLAQRFARPLRLEAIARELGVGGAYLARSYHATLGTRMHERLMSLRLAAALSRLSDGASDLTSLALELGFASHSHFTAAFRRRVGLPPSLFRAGCVNSRVAPSARRSPTR